MIIDGAKPDEPEALILLAAHRGGLKVEFKRKDITDAVWWPRTHDYVGTAFCSHSFYRAAQGENE